MSVIELNEVYKPKKNYTVIVKTITFNHSKYIEDTLNGIAMQNTNFPFVNIVLEDNSTDGEQDVIKIWLDRECNMSMAEYYDIPTAILIIVPHKKNINCSFAIYFHKENLFQQKDIRESQVHPWRSNSKYEALCEGDDYWIDPYKLQKQVDFLDQHLDVSMVFSNCHVLKENKYVDDEFFAFKGISNKYYNSNELYAKWIVPTASIVYRINCFKPYYDKRIYAGDIVIVLTLAEAGNIYGMLDYMTVYRLNDNGMTITREKNLSEKTFIRDINHTQFLKETFKSVSPKLYNRKLSYLYENLFLYKLKKNMNDKWKFFYLSLRYDLSRAIKSYAKRILKSLLFPNNTRNKQYI